MQPLQYPLGLLFLIRFRFGIECDGNLRRKGEIALFEPAEPDAAKRRRDMVAENIDGGLQQHPPFLTLAEALSVLFHHISFKASDLFGTSIPFLEKIFGRDASRFFQVFEDPLL